MKIHLEERTENTVRIYFEQSQHPFIQASLPQKAQSIEEAIHDYQETLLPSAKSFGRIIMVDEKYIGDVWCYCIDKTQLPSAMLSFCIFDRTYWNQHVASKAVALFLKEVVERYQLDTIGAFTFSDNIGSQRVLEKNGFQLIEEFIEEGKKSYYYQLNLDEIMFK